MHNEIFKMKVMNVGAHYGHTDATEGIEFDARILGDESVEFHFSCIAILDEEGRNFDIHSEFADFETVMNACDQDSALGIRLYNAFKSSVHNMLLGIHSQTCTKDYVTIVTVDEDDFTTMELKLIEEEV